MKSRRWAQLGSVLFAGSILGLVLASPACVHPDDDFDAYQARTKELRGLGGDAGPRPDTTPPPPIEGGVELTGVWFVSCLPALFSDSPQTSLLFRGDLVQTGTSLDVTFTPLKEDATTISKSDTLGAPFSQKGVTVTPDKPFDVLFGAVSIEGKAQRIGDSTIVIEDLALKDVRAITKDRLCSKLAGRLTSPLKVDLAGDGNFCLLSRTTEGAKLPTFKIETGQAIGFAGAEYGCP